MNQIIETSSGTNNRYVLTFLQNGIFFSFSPTVSDIASPAIWAISVNGSGAIFHPGFPCIYYSRNKDSIIIYYWDDLGSVC